MVKEFTGRDRGSNGGFGGRGRGRGRGKPNSNGVDWNCVECDNLNWSWRTTCNKCNAGRPVTFIVSLLPRYLNAFYLQFLSSQVGDNEVREGKAGGFDERQDRVSKAALEIDEEGYDDFGRRLSKSRNDKRAKEEAALKRLQQSYGFLLQGDDGDNENNITKDIESHPHKSESVKHNVNAGKEDNQRADDSKSKSNYNDKPVMSKARENNDTKRDRDRRDEGSMLKSDYTDKKHRADEFDKNRESRDEKNRDNQRDRDRDADRDHHIDKDKDRERDRHTRVSKSRDRYGLEHSDSRGRRDRYPSNKIVHGDSRGSNSNRRSNSRNRNSSDSYRRNQMLTIKYSEVVY